MILLIPSMLLIGGLLGMRFKVLVLIPVIGLAFMANLALGMARGDGVAATLTAAVLASICLQIGYLGGAMVRYGIVTARSQNVHKSALRTKSVHWHWG